MPQDQPLPSAFEDLATLAQTGAPGLARATLKVQTELFVQQAQAGDADDASFLALALTLLPLVDEQTARAVAARLAPRHDAPQPLIDALTARGGGVAETVIALAPRLGAAMRQSAASHEDPRLAIRLAARPDLDDSDQLTLLGRNEPVVSQALARNQGIRLHRSVAIGLMTAARIDPVLAHALLQRDDIDIVMLAPLYSAAGAAQRALIREAVELRIAERNLPMQLRDATAEEMARMMDASIEGVAALLSEVALASERDSGFVAAAAVDSSREIMGLALLSLGISPEDATRMLLRTGDTVAQDSRAVHAVVGLLRSTSRAAAEMILGASWPRGHWRGAGQHVPAMAPGGTPARAPALAPRKPSGGQVIERIRRIS